MTRRETASETAPAPTPAGPLIPFNKPGLVGREREYMAEAIERGQISGDGEFTGR